MIGQCKLYGNQTELRNSHIYPKFAVDYFKETGSKFLRTFRQPNRRQQDGLRRYFLSEKAEQKFSVSEKWFAEHMFKPFLKRGQKSFNYNEQLFYFVLSFLWRVLLLNLTEKTTKNEPHHDILISAELEWRSFLSKYIYPRNFDQVFVLLTDRVLSHNINAHGVDYFMTRTMDCTIVSNEENSYVAVYGKFLRFIFWAELKNEKRPDIREALKINPQRGTINFPQNFDDGMFSNFILNRILETQHWPKTTDTQQEKIANEIMNDPEKFMNSDAGKAIINDFERLNKQK